MSALTSATNLPDVAALRMLDMAKGVLIAVRRCTAARAFDEIVASAATCHVGALAMARALVELAENPAGHRHVDAAGEAAYRIWGDLFDAPRVLGGPTPFHPPCS